MNMPWKLYSCALSTDLPTLPTQETVGLKCGFFETRVNPTEAVGGPFILLRALGDSRHSASGP